MNEKELEWSHWNPLHSLSFVSSALYVRMIAFKRRGKNTLAAHTTSTMRRETEHWNECNARTQPIRPRRRKKTQKIRWRLARDSAIICSAVRSKKLLFFLSRFSCHIFEHKPKNVMRNEKSTEEICPTHQPFSEFSIQVISIHVVCRLIKWIKHEKFDFRENEKERTFLSFINK